MVNNNRVLWFGLLGLLVLSVLYVGNASAAIVENLGGPGIITAQSPPPDVIVGQPVFGVSNPPDLTLGEPQNSVYANLQIGGIGDIYKFNGFPTLSWTEIGEIGKEYVARYGTLYGLSLNRKDIYEYTGQRSWRQVGKFPRGVEIFGGAEGLYAVRQGIVYKYEGPFSWTNIGSPGPKTKPNPRKEQIAGVKMLAVGDGGLLYAIKSSDRSVWKYDNTPGSWSEIGAAPAEKILAAGELLFMVNSNDGKIYRYRGEEIGWNSICDSTSKGCLLRDNKAISFKNIVVSTSNLYGLSNDGNVWKYSPSSSVWEMIPTGPVVQIYGGAYGDNLYYTSPVTHTIWHYFEPPHEG